MRRAARWMICGRHRAFPWCWFTPDRKRNELAEPAVLAKAGCRFGRGLRIATACFSGNDPFHHPVVLRPVVDLLCLLFASDLAQEVNMDGHRITTRRAFANRLPDELLEQLEDVRHARSKEAKRRITLSALLEEAVRDFLARTHSSRQ